ncbi:MAG TPA: alpha/beta hydrolase [Acidimicrobiales bacterium]|nr:alpha/beta hydrolase [Acidimicrobiales bacterium]
MIVFLHGVPETSHIWQKVQAAIGRPSQAWDLPGFGCPRPAGFSATKDAYVDWVVDRIESLGEPVDLVGHDWGAGITYGVVTQRSTNIRSWAADVGAIMHPHYEWHDFAKIWQTPEEGEAFVAAQNEMPLDQRAQMFEGLGVPHDDALAMAGASDATMGSCILDLYRSAMPNPHSHWGPWEMTMAPGLVIHPRNDPFDDEARSREVADELGAQHVTIEASHFWGYEAPEEGARALTAFWDSLPG